MAFNFEIKNASDATVVHMTGALDEHAQLASPPAVPELYVDLEKLTYINSVGVRLWIRWITELSKQSKVVLIRCPALMVKNFGSIRGMLNKNVIVQSFYVPYYDDNYDERRNYLFVRGKEFGDDGSLTMPVVKSSTGAVIEPDIIEETYFSFLRLKYA